MYINFYKNKIITQNQKELSIFYSKPGYSSRNLIQSLEELIQSKSSRKNVFSPCVIIFGDSIIDSSFYEEILYKLKENGIKVFIIAYPSSITNLENLYNFVTNSILRFLYENKYEILQIYIREKSYLIEKNAVYKLRIFKNILDYFDSSLFFDIQI